MDRQINDEISKMYINNNEYIILEFDCRDKTIDMLSYLGSIYKLHIFYDVSKLLIYARNNVLINVDQLKAQFNKMQGIKYLEHYKYAPDLKIMILHDD